MCRERDHCARRSSGAVQPGVRVALEVEGYTGGRRQEQLEPEACGPGRIVLNFWNFFEEKS